MKNFTIEANSFLNEDTVAYYHDDYHPGKWGKEGCIENIICTLKNDITPFHESILQNRSQLLSVILKQDLPQILRHSKFQNLTVCVVPRAKVNYQKDQLLFSKTISDVVSKLPGFINGTNFIRRILDTRTTHRNKFGYGGNGPLPYEGITINTCNISEEVKGKDILLIDDLYTETINIDEDAIQALLDKGAKSVTFYAIGKTISQYY